MAFDLHVLIQTVLYFAIVITGLVIAVPLGVTVIEFHNRCVLYTDYSSVKKDGHDIIQFHLSSPGYCNFAVFNAVVACILYSLGVGIYNAYALIKIRDPNFRYQMWVWPFLMVNSAITIVTFIACCIVSVGLKESCDGLEEIKRSKFGFKGAFSCASADDTMWTAGSDLRVDSPHFYSYPKTSELAGWIVFLIWATQVVFCVIRVIRNRRFFTQDTDTGPTLSGDLNNFAAEQPTA